MDPWDDEFEGEASDFDREEDPIDSSFIGDYCEMHPNETDEEFWEHEDFDDPD
jgi:hypothetical protein